MNFNENRNIFMRTKKILFFIFILLTATQKIEFGDIFLEKANNNSLTMGNLCLLNDIIQGCYLGFVDGKAFLLHIFRDAKYDQKLHFIL